MNDKWLTGNNKTVTDMKRCSNLINKPRNANLTFPLFSSVE